MSKICLICTKQIEGSGYLECEGCKQSYHSHCLGVNERHINKFFCAECENDVNKVTFRDECLEAFITCQDNVQYADQFKCRLVKTSEELLAQHYDSPEKLTLESFSDGEFKEPIVIDNLKQEKVSLKDVFEQFSPMTDLRLVNGKDLLGYKVKIGQYAKYLQFVETDRTDRTPFACVSIELSKTSLKNRISIPKLVNHINMLKDIKDYNEGSLCVERFYLHFMKDAWIDFHLDFTGSSIWHHVLKGEEVLYFLDSSEAIRRIYMDWVAKGRHGKLMELLPVNFRIRKLTLKEGQTLFLPGGTIRATSAAMETSVVGGNFLTFTNASIQFSSYQMEVAGKEEDSYIFPQFEHWNKCAVKMLKERIDRDEDLTHSEELFCRVAEEGMKNWKDIANFLTKVIAMKDKLKALKREKTQGSQGLEGSRSEIVTRSASRKQKMN